MTAAPIDLLLVEDDPDTMEATTDVLQAAGYRVHGAAHGRDALAWLGAHPAPRLIVLDLMMPVMNGWQFRAAQLEDPRLAGIPVLLVSAGHSLEADARALQVRGFIAKPVELAALLHEIRRCLG